MYKIVFVWHILTTKSGFVLLKNLSYIRDRWYCQHIIFCPLWLHNSSSALGSLCASSHFIVRFLRWILHASLQILLVKNTIYHTLARKFAIQCTLGINKFFHTRPVLLHIVNSKKNMCSLCKYNMHFSSCYGLLLLNNKLHNFKQKQVTKRSPHCIITFAS